MQMGKDDLFHRCLFLSKPSSVMSGKTQLETKSRDSRKIQVRAEVHWLHFSWCSFHLKSQLDYYTDLATATWLYHSTSNLPSLQPCPQSWEVIALGITQTAPSEGPISKPGKALLTASTSSHSAVWASEVSCRTQQTTFKIMLKQRGNPA